MTPHRPHLFAFDTETELIERGCLAPRLVCLSEQSWPGDQHTPGQPRLFNRWEASDLVRTLVDVHADPVLWIGHNVAYDFGVLAMHDESLIPAIFNLYRRGVVRDTLVREKLIAIREGRTLEHEEFSLDALNQRYQGAALDKGSDSWRYRYGELIDTPVSEWPPAARDYALTDAACTLRIFGAQQVGLDQVDLIPESWDRASMDADQEISPDEVLQTRAAWVLHLMALWGFRTDPERVATLKASLEIECHAAEQHLLASGIYKISGSQKAIREGRGKVSKDMGTIKSKIVRAFAARDHLVPMTGPSASHPEGQVQTSEEVLRATGDPDLLALAESGASHKILTTNVPRLEEGTRVPINPRWNVLVNTGRTSCGSKTSPGNWQNPPKKGGVRECVIPRPGTVFIGADYAQIELCSLAQVLWSWFGASEMATAIRAGRDLHLELACSTPLLLGHLEYAEAKRLRDAGDDAVDGKRNFAKVANFGFPGGLGAETFVAYAAGYGITTDYETADALKRAWRTRWPEMNAYFARISTMVDIGRPVEQFFSGRLRGKPEFCSTANTFFQGLTADGCKEALWQVAWDCYRSPRSALFGSRIILFLHDELILESPEDRASDAADELARIMILAMQRWIPDIPIKADVRMFRRWYKAAKEVRDASGRLIPWEPKAEAAA